MKVQEFLAGQKVPFELLDHRPTYSAQNLAQEVHVSGTEVAKSVLLRTDDDYVLAVLPANRAINMTMARSVMGADDMRIAREAECGSHFPDCELGALPPFGSQYGMKTLVDVSLMEDEEFVFEGNSHREAIRMRFDDFQRLEQPMMASFSHRR